MRWSTISRRPSRRPRSASEACGIGAGWRLAPTVAFGGPVAQIAMIRRDLVEEERWISSAGFNRLLAVMQVLPGPEAHELCVHLGMVARGRIGGLLAGLGFMLPGFVLVLGLAALYSRFDLSDPAIASAMLGIQIAVIALIVVAIVHHRLAHAGGSRYGRPESWRAERPIEGLVVVRLGHDRSLVFADDAPIFVDNLAVILLIVSPCHQHQHHCRLYPSSSSSS